MTELGTTCVQGGYHPGDAEPRQIPIYQSTTWKYDTSKIEVAGRASGIRMGMACS